MENKHELKNLTAEWSLSKSCSFSQTVCISIFHCLWLSLCLSVCLCLSLSVSSVSVCLSECWKELVQILFFLSDCLYLYLSLSLTDCISSHWNVPLFFFIWTWIWFPQFSIHLPNQTKYFTYISSMFLSKVSSIQYSRVLSFESRLKAPFILEDCISNSKCSSWIEKALYWTLTKLSKKYSR